MPDEPLTFRYRASSARIVFERDARMGLSDHIRKLDRQRAFLVATPEQAADAHALCRLAAPFPAEAFPGAKMHTPVDVTEEALARLRGFRADCIVSLGGGSSTGLGKALSWRTGLPQIAVPTTYAGSEVTDILGETDGGRKTTIRDERIFPELVLYDVELTLGLPVRMSVASGLNAMAHAAEALYAGNRNPISTLMAVEGLRAFREALPAIVDAPRDIAARERALYGSWLCGTVLGMVDMALHHKICHTLGGSFDLPHGETHAVMLPHTVGYNVEAAGVLLEPLAALFGDSPGRGLHGFARALDAPMSLRDLGMREADLDRAARIATENPYPNPRPVDPASIRAMLQRAWEGATPEF